MKRLIAGFFMISLSACASSPSTQSGIVYGGIAGAGVGALAGSASGNAGPGAAIGAAGGATVGALIAAHEDDKDQVIDQQKQILGIQEAEHRRQQKELDDVRRQQYYDDLLKQHED